MSLLAPELPLVTFLVQLPFPVVDILEDLLPIVVPMPAMRTGEREDTEVQVNFKAIKQKRRTSTAAVDYLKSLPGRKASDYLTVSAQSAMVSTKVTVAELTTPNVLPDATTNTHAREVGVLLFRRCLDALKRTLAAYIVATEDQSVRPLSAEALGDYTVVEFRDHEGKLLQFGGFITLPSSVRPPSYNRVKDNAELLTRLSTSLRHEEVHHPMDTVVLWQARARHYLDVAPDYEMALLALNISAEVLLDAIWTTHRVDEGQDSSLHDEEHPFSKTLKTVAEELGVPWDRANHDTVMTQASFDLRVGGRVWFDGQGWEVVELTGPAARLSANGVVRAVSFTSLVGSRADETDPPDLQATKWEIPAVVVAGLTTQQQTQLAARLDILRGVLEPDSRDGRTIRARYDAAAASVGVSRRTLQRQAARLLELGPAGLVDARLRQDVRRTVDPRWGAICLEVLSSFVNESNPTKQSVINRANREFQRQVPDGKVPSTAVAYRRLEELDKGRYTFGVAKQRRSVARRPIGVLGRLRADRPGQYVLLDSYRLDVFAMEPVTLRWVSTELTVAMDLFDRRVTGLRLRPIAARSPDVASVLFQTVTPQTWGWAVGSPEGPYGGLPENLVLGDPGGVLPDTIVVDHGKIYLSDHTRGVCERLGISIQPAIPDKPTDKPALERFFRTLRQSLLEHLPGYKGPDVAARGKNVEGEAFYYVTELEQIIREWVGRVYHHTAHAGLVDPLERSVALSPAEMLERGIAAAGRIRLPAREDLVYDFLEVEWRTIQHYGVEVNGQRYDGPGLNDHRGTRSPYGGAHPGKWPFMVDRDDIRTVHFRDPTTQAWHRLEWEHAAQIDAPFSADVAAYVRALGAKTHRHVDPQQAVHELLSDWTAGEVSTRRDRNLAVRLSAQRAADGGNDDAVIDDREAASIPGVVDLLARRRTPEDVLTDDLDDVFTRYYAEHPDADGLEVFDE